MAHHGVSTAEGAPQEAGHGDRGPRTQDCVREAAVSGGGHISIYKRGSFRVRGKEGSLHWPEGEGGISGALSCEAWAASDIFSLLQVTPLSLPLCRGGQQGASDPGNR